MDKFIVNIIHRPEMVPEYAEKVTGHGKEEDIGRKELLTESLDIFKTQQAIAHKNGLKTTIQMTYASLFNDEAVLLAKEDMRNMETRLHYLYWDFPARNSERNIKRRISVSGCFLWRIRSRLWMMCLVSSMTGSDFTRNPQDLIIWMPIW